MKVKELSVVIGLVLTIIGAGVGYGQLQAKANETEKKVEEVKEDIKSTEEAIDTEENINIRQTIMLENMSKIQERAINALERLEAKQ